jgi:hypothetical protein
MILTSVAAVPRHAERQLALPHSRSVSLALVYEDVTF